MCKCGAPSRPTQRYCGSCRASYMRSYRAKYGQNPKNGIASIKQRAREFANVHYRRKGIKNPCEVCGRTENIEKHHDDYSKPLVVRWLCRKHHLMLHVEHKESNV